MADSQLLVNYMHSRHSPVEASEKIEKKKFHQAELEDKCMYNILLYARFFSLFTQTFQVYSSP
jgi:hypothetical protein